MQDQNPPSNQRLVFSLQHFPTPHVRCLQAARGQQIKSRDNSVKPHACAVRPASFLHSTSPRFLPKTVPRGRRRLSALPLLRKPMTCDHRKRASGSERPSGWIHQRQQCHRNMQALGDVAAALQQGRCKQNFLKKFTKGRLFCFRRAPLGSSDLSHSESHSSRRQS